MASMGFAETNARQKEIACSLHVTEPCVLAPAQSPGGHVSLLIL